MAHPRCTKSRLLVVTGILAVLHSAMAARVFEPQSPPQSSASDTGKPIDVPKFIVCDPITFLNCHKEPGVAPPKLIHAVNAEYADDARRLHLEGMSVVKLIIDEKGRPQNVTVIRSFADKLPTQQQYAGLQMDRKAVDAVKKYRFQPATLNGRAVPTEVTVEVKFHLI